MAEICYIILFTEQESFYEIECDKCECDKIHH